MMHGQKNIKKLMCLIQFQPLLVLLNLLIAEPKGKLRSRDNKVSPCFRSFLIGNVWHEWLPIRIILYVSFQHIDVKLIIVGIPNSVSTSSKTCRPTKP